MDNLLEKGIFHKGEDMGNQKGVTLGELAIVLATLGAIILIAASSLRQASDSVFFENMFGFLPNAVNDVTRPLLQPEVTSTLNADFRAYRGLAEACKSFAEEGEILNPQDMVECATRLYKDGVDIERATRLAAKAGFIIGTATKPSGPGGQDKAGAK